MLRRSPALKRLQTQRGFSLLEILITSVVLGIGLLGIAGMQMASMRFARQSNQRYLAMLQANDMVDRMRANQKAVAAGQYDAITGTGSKPSCASTTSGCSPANMAQLDRYEWNTANASLLPGGSGTVQKAAGAGNYTITVSWQQLEKNQATPVTKSQTLRVKIS